MAKKSWVSRNKKPIIITGSVLVLGTATVLIIKAINKKKYTREVYNAGTGTTTTVKVLPPEKKKKMVNKAIEAYRS